MLSATTFSPSKALLTASLVFLVGLAEYMAPLPTGWNWPCCVITAVMVSGNLADLTLFRTTLTTAIFPLVLSPPASHCTNFSSSTLSEAV